MRQSRLAATLALSMLAISALAQAQSAAPAGSANAQAMLPKNVQISGKTLDGAMVQLGLQKLDAWIKAFLAGESLALPEEELPAVAPSEAPADSPAAPAS